MISEEIVYKKISDFENREDIFSLTLKGVCIWRIVRSVVFHRIQNIGLSGMGSKKRRFFIPVARSLLTILSFVLFKKKPKYAVFSYSFALRSRDSDGLFSDFYYQEIMDEIPGGVRLLNDWGAKKNRETKKNIKNIDLSFFSFLAVLLARIFPVNSIKGEYSTLSSAIKKEWGLVGIDENKLKRWFSFFWWESRLKGWVFSLLGLNFVFIVNSGEYSTIKACVDRGIKIIELQHGIYTKNHPDVLPRKCIEKFGRQALFLPDVIALYGDYWVEQLASTYKNSSVELIPVGYAACDAMRSQRNKNYSANKSGISVLVTTQGFQRKELISFIKTTLTKCSGSVLFFIKLHPVYDVDREDYLQEFRDDKRVKIIFGNNAPTTSDLLTTVDLHASIASACHYDALSIGLPTIVINLPGNELVYPLVKEGRALFAENPLHLARLIESKPSGELDECIQNYYVRPHFIENIVKLISQQSIVG